MRCPCGYGQFGTRTKLARAEKATRYVPADEATRRGLGSVLLGTAMGVGTASYGKLELTVSTGYLETVCLSCHRPRSRTRIGGGAMLGAWRVGREVYMLMSDVQDPACTTARLFGAGVRQDLPVAVDTEAEIPTLGTETETVPTLPYDAVLGDTVYRVTLPEELADGSYSLVLQDKCLGVATPVMTLLVPEPQQEPEGPEEPYVVEERLRVHVYWYFRGTFPVAHRIAANYDAVDAAIEQMEGMTAPERIESEEVAHGGDTIKPWFVPSVVLPYNPGGHSPNNVIAVEEFTTRLERVWSDGAVNNVPTPSRNTIEAGQVLHTVTTEHEEPYVPPPPPAYSAVDPTSWGQWLLANTTPFPQSSFAGSERNGRAARDFIYTTFDPDDLMVNGTYVPHPSKYHWSMGGSHLNRHVEGIAGDQSFRYGNPAFTLIMRAKVFSFTRYNNLLGEVHLSGQGSGATIYLQIRPDRRLGMMQFQYSGIGTNGLAESQPTSRVVPTLEWPEDGAWHVVSFRYDPATYEVRFGIDDIFENTSQRIVMLPPNNTRMELRGINGFGFDANVFDEADALLADLGAWRRYLSDGEIIERATAMLGVLPGGGIA